MSRRFLSCEEVVERVLESSDDDGNDLDELNTSDSDSESENNDISPSTCNPDQTGLSDESGDEGSASESKLNESFEESQKKRKGVDTQETCLQH